MRHVMILNQDRFLWNMYRMSFGMLLISNSSKDRERDHGRKRRRAHMHRISDCFWTKIPLHRSSGWQVLKFFAVRLFRAVQEKKSGGRVGFYIQTEEERGHAHAL
jgi:hypothetical protein